MANLTSSDGIVLLAKKTGLTSFASLHSVKKALGTTKVGHTGTLDSFAQGLLVVCTGRLTKLAGKITEFDKAYEAVIKFGEETDTLEYTGQTVRTAPLPSEDQLFAAVKKFTGNILQAPPAFSAIHVNGKRASDLAREGKAVEIPPRPITVFEAKITETKITPEGLVEYCKINFTVSKGTYIRCLARDIAKEAGSAGHLIGLYRTRVGNFDIKDSAGFYELKEFTINSAIKATNNSIDINNRHPEDSLLQEEIRKTIRSFDRETASLCGINSITLADDAAEKDFCNGKPLRSPLFTIKLHTLAPGFQYAVFSINETFRGIIEKDTSGRLHYIFTISN